jgi:hypothetical protein
MSKINHTNIPDGYDLRKIIEKLISELLMRNLDDASVKRIIDAGRPKII